MSFSGLAVAVQFLTRFPVPAASESARPGLAGAQVWFPFVGGFIGLAVALGLGTGIFFGPWFGALAALSIWVGVTGALHLDGLGDTADGLGAAHASRERFLEVVRDPRAGNFAIVAISLVLMAKLVLLAAINPAASFLALVLVPAWARWLVLALAKFVPPAGEGLGAQFAVSIDRRMIALWAAGLAVVSLAVAPVLLSALVLAPVAILYWRRRLGFISGDCHGASIEVMEALLLAALVMAGG
jgi:adenosylcobinamide-GDP ribazoletransferase